MYHTSLPFGIRQFITGKKINIYMLTFWQGRIQSWGQGVRTPPPPENHKNIGFPSNTGLDPEKSQSYQANVQCCSIIDTPFKWRFADRPMMISLRLYLDHLSPLIKNKNKIKRYQGLTPSDKTFCIRACLEPSTFAV